MSHLSRPILFRLLSSRIEYLLFYTAHWNFLVHVLITHMVTTYVHVHKSRCSSTLNSILYASSLRSRSFVLYIRDLRIHGGGRRSYVVPTPTRKSVVDFVRHRHFYDRSENVRDSSSHNETRDLTLTIQCCAMAPRAKPLAIRSR